MGSSRASGVEPRKAATSCSFSVGSTEQVQYNSMPPGARHGHKASRIRRCSALASTIWRGVRNILISGWLYPFQARGAVVERHQLDAAAALEQLTTLATGCGAGIEHALWGMAVEQIGGQLRGLVLHADQPVGESRQRHDIHRLLQHHRIGCKRAGT